MNKKRWHEKFDGHFGRRAIKQNRIYKTPDKKLLAREMVALAVEQEKEYRDCFESGSLNLGANGQDSRLDKIIEPKNFTRWRKYLALEETRRIIKRFHHGHKILRFVGMLYWPEGEEAAWSRTKCAKAAGFNTLNQANTAENTFLYIFERRHRALKKEAQHANDALEELEKQRQAEETRRKNADEAKRQAKRFYANRKTKWRYEKRKMRDAMKGKNAPRQYWQGDRPKFRR